MSMMMNRQALKIICNYRNMVQTLVLIPFLMIANPSLRIAKKIMKEVIKIRNKVMVQVNNSQIKKN